LILLVAVSANSLGFFRTPLNGRLADTNQEQFLAPPHTADFGGVRAWQLCNIHRNPPRRGFGEQFRRRPPPRLALVIDVSQVLPCRPSRQRQHQYWHGTAISSTLKCAGSSVLGHSLVSGIAGHPQARNNKQGADFHGKDQLD